MSIECKFYNYSEEPNKMLANSIVVQKVNSDFQQLIVMNSKECQSLEHWLQNQQFFLLTNQQEALMRATLTS